MQNENSRSCDVREWGSEFLCAVNNCLQEDVPRRQATGAQALISISEALLHSASMAKAEGEGREWKVRSVDDVLLVEGPSLHAQFVFRHGKFHSGQIFQEPDIAVQIQVPQNASEMWDPSVAQPLRQGLAEAFRQRAISFTVLRGPNQVLERCFNANGELVDMDLSEMLLRLTQAQIDSAVKEYRRNISAYETEPVEQAVPSAKGDIVSVCGSCGGGVKAAAKFCGHCGAVVNVSSPVAKQAAICSACRAPLRAGVQFCGACGARVTA